MMLVSIFCLVAVVAAIGYVFGHYDGFNKGRAENAKYIYLNKDSYKEQTRIMKKRRAAHNKKAL